MTLERARWSTIAEKEAVETVPLAARWQTPSVHAMLGETAAAHPDRPALSFQLRSGPRERAETLDWATLARQATQAANLFRRLGVGPEDTVAFLLPNCPEAVVTLLGGMTAGIVCPINPLLEPPQIAAILNDTRAKVLVCLGAFPRTDIAQKAHAAAAMAPSVATVLEVDLARHLPFPLRLAVRVMRPSLRRHGGARTLGFRAALRAEDGARLGFDEDARPDRVSASFHTGGTTGLPKIALHRQDGMIYNGKVPAMSMIDHEDVLICPLPMFHVLGAYPILMGCLASGAHLVLPTPAGYRGDGVIDNFWALVERWRVSFMVMVPTAAAALMQRPVRHDVSSLKYALCGSAPLPPELFRRFEEATGVRILEGYGMTEATCLVSINPPDGQRKVGSVGLPIPYTQVRILDCAADGTIRREMGPGEIGEICVASPAVFPGYAEAVRNHGLFAGPGRWLRTGDLGRIDEDGYLWITGRSKDLIIRGGHNIDPGLIEEALARHPAVAFAAAIGQPDDFAGELPCAYVELCAGAEATVEDLLAHAHAEIPERAAVPKHLEILPELPKTAVGKVFKPALRKRAIARVYVQALAGAGIEASVETVEDSTRGMVAEIRADASDEAVQAVLGTFAVPWRRAG